MRTDGWTDMTKLLVAFQNFENEHKKSNIIVRTLRNIIIMQVWLI